MRSSLWFRGWRPIVGVVAIGLVAFGLSLQAAPAGDDGRAKTDQEGRVAYNDTADASADLAAPPSADITEVPARESIFPDAGRQAEVLQDQAEAEGRTLLPPSLAAPAEASGVIRANNEDNIEVVVPTMKIRGDLPTSPRCTGPYCNTTVAIGQPCDCNAECNDDLRCNGEERCDNGVCIEGAETFPSSTGGCLEDADMPGADIPGNSGNGISRCQTGTECSANSGVPCVEPQACVEVTCGTQWCTDHYTTATERQFCFDHPGGAQGQRCVDDATVSLSNPGGPGTCTVGTQVADCPSGECLDQWGICKCTSDAECYNGDCNEATGLCRSTGYECDFEIPVGGSGAGNCSLVVGTCCTPGAPSTTAAPTCSGDDIISCNTAGGTWISDREATENNTSDAEVGCLNSCPRYSSGIEYPGQGDTVGGGVPGVVDLGPVVDVPCNGNGFESIGDDYHLAGGDPIVLERFSWTGGVDSPIATTVVFQFYDTSFNLAAELRVAAGRARGIRTYGTRQNPLYRSGSLASSSGSMAQPIIPADGYIVMRSPTIEATGDRDTGIHWFTTNTPPRYGDNTANSMWVNGVVADHGTSLGLGANSQVLSFELRGVPLPDATEACCANDGSGCTDTLPWLCNKCSGGGAADGEFCTEDRDCWRCTGGSNQRCWSDDQCANQSAGTCDMNETCDGDAFLARQVECQGEHSTSDPTCSPSTCVFYANADALDIDTYPPSGYCQNKCAGGGAGDPPCDTGACCNAGGCTEVANASTCTTAGGDWQGYGTDCDPNCCPAGDQGGDYCWQATPYVLNVPTSFGEKIVQTITTTTANSSDGLVPDGLGPVEGECEFKSCSVTGYCNGAPGTSCNVFAQTGCGANGPCLDLRCVDDADCPGGETCRRKPCTHQKPMGDPLACAPGRCGLDPDVRCRTAGDCPQGILDSCQGVEVCERFDCGDPNVPSLGWRATGDDPAKWEAFTLNECAYVTIDYCCTDDNPNDPQGRAAPQNYFFDTCESGLDRQKYCEGLKQPDFPSGIACDTDADCPAGTCSVGGAACHDTNDCPLGTCSTTTSLLCRRDEDCPGGETCSGGEHRCISGQACERTRDFCGPNDDQIVRPEYPDPDGTQSSFGWYCGGGDTNWAQQYELPPGTYYFPIRALQTCAASGINCNSDKDCPDGDVCQEYEHEYQIHITTEKCQQSSCCRLGEVCQGGDLNNPADWCADATAGHCESSEDPCTSDYDCAPGSCSVSGDPCHLTYEYPPDDGGPLVGGDCDPPELCVGFERCILDDCADDKVCSDDFSSCSVDGDCTAGTCSTGKCTGDPGLACTVNLDCSQYGAGTCDTSSISCHTNFDCPAGRCSASGNLPCRDSDDPECPTTFVTCTKPAPGVCVGGASCDPQKCTTDNPLCEVTDKTNCEQLLHGFWVEGADECIPPGTPAGENVCFVGSCCTDDAEGDRCKDSITYNSLEGCATWSGGHVFVPGAQCDDDPCPVCEIEDPANCQTFDASTGFISRCDGESGTTTPNWRCADDFVAASAGPLNRVCWWPAYAPVTGPECSAPAERPPDDWTLRIYPDLGHIPDEGAELGPAGGQALHPDVTAPISGRVWQNSAPVDTPIVLDANECYWIEINGKGSETCDIFWATSNRGNDYAMQDFNFPDFGRYTSEDATNADFAWCVSTGIVSSGPLDSGCGEVTGACCTCGCPGQEPICQAVSQDACASEVGCNEFSGKWKIYRICENSGLKCQEDSDCDPGEDCIAPPSQDQCDIDPGARAVSPCGGEPANDACADAITVSHAAAHCAGDNSVCDATAQDCAAGQEPCVPDDINEANNPVGSANGSACQDIRCATTDGPVTNCGTSPGDLSFDVWYRYTAPVCGTLTIQYCDSLPIFDGFGAAYRVENGDCATIIGGGASDVACNDDGCGAGGPWNYQLDVGEGEEIIFRVGSWFDGDPTNYARGVDEGCFDLHLEPLIGDRCAAAVGDPLGLAPTSPQGRRKNRYIAFDPNKAENDGTDVAFKVELKAIWQGSCNDGTGGKVDFCRLDRGASDCGSCAGGAGGTCISTPVHCSTGGGVCTPTGATCVNDQPNGGGSNVGQVWWVGPEHPTTHVHLLVSEPFRKHTDNWANPVIVGDCEVVPEAVYGVKAVATSSSEESAELVVSTAAVRYCSVSGNLCIVDADCPGVETCNIVTPAPSPYWWADIVGQLKYYCNANITQPECDPGNPGVACGSDPCLRAWSLPNGVVSFDDVNALITQFTPPGVGVPAEKTWVDMHPVGGDAAPDLNVSASDLQQVIFGFAGFPYTGFDPKDCDPAVVSWP